MLPSFCDGFNTHHSGTLRCRREGASKPSTKPRYGERVSTGFVESTVNTVVGKRFCKRQQMRWSKTGAHLMLQTRTRTLDGTLRKKFQQWYPGMKSDGDQKMAA